MKQWGKSSGISKIMRLVSRRPTRRCQGGSRIFPRAQRPMDRRAPEGVAAGAIRALGAVITARTAVTAAAAAAMAAAAMAAAVVLMALLTALHPVSRNPALKV